MEDKTIKGNRTIKMKFLNRKDNSKRKYSLKIGFTLIELIVVMAVIAILVLLAAPKFLGYTQKAEETKYIHTAKVIETALDAYLINGGGIGDGLTIVDSTMLTESVANKNLINAKGYMISVDTDTYYELTDDFIKANLDIKLSASNSTPFIIEAHAAKSLKAPNAVYASSDGEVIINKEQTLKGYVSPIVVDDDIETPVGEVIETPIEEVVETPIEEVSITRCDIIQGTPREYFTFNTTTGTITAYSSTGPKDVVIPCKIDGVSVKAIGDNVFKSKGLTSVVIPDSVTSIGYMAFYLNALTSLTIGSSVQTIGDYAFHTNALTSVVIPNSVTSIGAGVFQYNALTSVTIGSSVKTIGVQAFNSTTLKNITIGKDVAIAATSTIIADSKTMPFKFETWYLSYDKTAGTYKYDDAASRWRKEGSEAFYIVDSTGKITSYVGTGQSIVIPSEVNGITVKAIGDNVFKSKGLTSAVIPDSVTSIGYMAFYLNALTSLTIGSSVQTIGDYAFHTNALTSVVIPNSVTSIGAGVFQGNALTSVTVGSSVKTIGVHAFNSTTLKNITIGKNVAIAATSTIIADSKTMPFKFETWYLSYDKTAGTYKYDDAASRWRKEGSEAFYIVDSTGKITSYVGTGQSIVIPSEVNGITVKAIGDNVFKSKGLTSVVIPDSVTSIGYMAFHLNALTSLTIGSSVQTIGDYAFHTNVLTSVVIPNSVLSIGTSAFTNNGPSKNSGTITTKGAKTWTLVGTTWN